MKLQQLIAETVQICVIIWASLKWLLYFWTSRCSYYDKLGAAAYSYSAEFVL